MAREWQIPMRDWLQRWALDEAEIQRLAHIKRRRSPKTFRYVVPDFQADMIDALNKGDEERAKALKLSTIR